MSPRTPLPRKSLANYTQSVSWYLPVKQPVIAWQAKPIVGGEHWQIVTAKGEMQAAVFQTVCKTDLSAQHAAQLMANAPLLLNELALAHEIIRAALSVMGAQTKGQWADKNALLGIDGEGTTRANERFSLLVKHRHLLGGVQ